MRRASGPEDSLAYPARRQGVPKKMRHPKDAQTANCVDKQRVAAIKGVNIAAAIW